MEDPLVLYIKNNQLDMSKPESYDLLLHENTEIEFLSKTKQIYSMQEIDV